MTPDLQTSFKSFKQRKSLAVRKEEVANIRMKFPAKVPVVVERYSKETRLASLDKMKFLVPQELTMSQFVTIIRNRLHLHASQAFYLMAGNRSISSLSKTMGEIYKCYRDEDGFLYFTYASQEMFGGLYRLTKTINLPDCKHDQILNTMVDDSESRYPEVKTTTTFMPCEMVKICNGLNS
ncbi:Microtubule-associated proteins 1A/1B light chain 3C [Chamberlinius hualienensis]